MKKLIWLLPLVFLVFISCEKDNEPPTVVDTTHIYKITIEYLYDDCTGEITYKNQPSGIDSIEVITGAEHDADFNSLTGIIDAAENYFTSTWDTVVSGTTTRGKMEVYFRDKHTINIDLDQTREYSTPIDGDVFESFTFNAQGISFTRTSTEAGYPVDRYEWMGTIACRASVSYLDENAQLKTELKQLGCGPKARVVVKVFLKS